MRLINITLIIFALALLSTSAMALCVIEPEPTATCPIGCAPSVAAGAGAGPVPSIIDLTGSAFDQAYMERMYDLHGDIALLATQGIQLAGDKQLRDLSGKIRYEQTKQSDKLAMWYRQRTGQYLTRADFSMAQAQINSLQGLTGNDFDVQYAKTMIGYLQQAQEAALLAVDRATFPELQNQAEITARAAYREIRALQRWIDIFAMPRS